MSIFEELMAANKKVSHYIEKDKISVIRKGPGEYSIIKDYGGGDTAGAHLEVKDKYGYVFVDAILKHYEKPASSKTFAVCKKDVSVKGYQELRKLRLLPPTGSSIVYGDGEIAGDSHREKLEEQDRQKKKHIHHILQDHPNAAKIYRAIISELDKIDIFEGIGTALDEFHKKAEPAFYQRISGNVADETPAKAAYGGKQNAPQKNDDLLSRIELEDIPPKAPKSDDLDIVLEDLPPKSSGEEDIIDLTHLGGTDAHDSKKKR